MTTPGGRSEAEALAPSQIPAALVEAYRNTLYRCGRGNDGLTLRIGEGSGPLAQLYESTGHQSALFITAYSPFSEPHTPEANAEAHARLVVELQALGLPVLYGAGTDPTGAWPEEESCLVVGVNLETARALGRRYQQNAVVWAGTDAVPTLVLLR